MKIAIVGAGIAGPTLAYWLGRSGHEAVLIEHAPRLRSGGYVIDFWGLGFAIAERMGLSDAIRAEGYAPDEVRFVDENSRKVGGFDMEVVRDLTEGRFTSIRRSALSRIIFEALRPEVETMFDVEVSGFEPRQDCVAVELSNGETHEFDVVVGADGLHSAVRTLRFGPQEAFETDLGYAVAAFEVKGYRPRDEGVYVIHSTPSHQVARFALRGDRTLFLFVWRRERDAGHPREDAVIRDILRAEFGDFGWEAPEILQGMDSAEEIYFDRVSQIRMERWHKGRVVLLGDAAGAVSLLAGEGTGLAMVGAYVLAGELKRSGENYQDAFAAYEKAIRPLIEAKQIAAERFAANFVPKTEFGLWARNQATKLMHIPGVSGLLIGENLRDDFELPDYGW